MNESSSHKALKSGFWYIIGNFVAKAAGFATTPIFTRLLTTGEVGDFSNLLSWVEILIVIATLNLYSVLSIARFDFKKDLYQFISSNLVLGSLWTLVVYCLCICFKEKVLLYTGLSELEFNITFVYLLVYPSLQMLLIHSRILYRYKTTVLLSLLSTFASTIISLVCVLLFTERLVGRIIGYFVPLILINLTIYVYLMVRGKSISPKYWKYSLTISIPLVWHSLAGSILGSSDRVMIRYFWGNEPTAFYSIAYYCALILSVLWSAVNNAWSPWAYEKMNEGKTDELKRAARPLVGMMVFVVIVFLLFGPEILFLMGGSNYLEAISVIPPVMVAYVFQVVYSLYVNIEFFHKKQNYIAIGTTIAAIINIILNSVFIPLFGYSSAAYTTLIGYAVLLMVHFFFVKKMGKETWYDTKFNFIILTTSVVLMFAMTFIYKVSVIRYCLVLLVSICLTVLVFAARKEINECIKSKSIFPLTAYIKRVRGRF